MSEKRQNEKIKKRIILTRTTEEKIGGFKKEKIFCFLGVFLR